MNALWLGLWVALGASLGGLARWGAGLWLNPLWLHGFPLGTLTVNMVGGLLAGAAHVWFARQPAEALRLLCVTGFLGGLTTFSSFSAESLALIEKDRWALALGHSLIHVVGALACAALGARLMRQWLA